VVVAAERDVEAVDLGDLDAAAANGCAHHDRAFGAAAQLEARGVRMRVLAEIGVDEFPGQAPACASS
jgi:hypothetical protein